MSTTTDTITETTDEPVTVTPERALIIELQTAIEELRDVAEEHSYSERYGKPVLAVDVKLRKSHHYASTSDVFDIIDKLTDKWEDKHSLGVSGTVKAKAKEGITDELIQSWWDRWVDNEQEYLASDAFSCGCYSAECLEGDQKRWVTYFADEKKYFTGRSGGWFVLAPVSIIDSHIEDAEREIEYFEEFMDDDSNKESVNYETERAGYMESLGAHIAELKDIVAALQWLVSDIEKARDGMDFHEQIKEYYVLDLIAMAEEEVKEQDAIELLQKRGYVVGKKLN